MADKLLKFRQMAKLLGPQAYDMTPSVYKEFDSMNAKQLNKVCTEYYEKIIVDPDTDMESNCIRCAKQLFRGYLQRYVRFTIQNEQTTAVAYPDFVGDDIELRELIEEVTPGRVAGLFFNDVHCFNCRKVHYIRYYKYVYSDYMQKVPLLLEELAKMVREQNDEERNALISENERLKKIIHEISSAISS